jgi:hypothetical protein
MPRAPSKNDNTTDTSDTTERQIFTGWSKALPLLSTDTPQPKDTLTLTRTIDFESFTKRVRTHEAQERTARESSPIGLWQTGDEVSLASFRVKGIGSTAKGTVSEIDFINRSITLQVQL